ncbi:unnamed protein product [Blepharisma stoltei]|uniref:Uncharacterized protein n=1 Tax=Blepharisma stoltei TaxID=1481888 RepID=A0AAU9JZE8_9CILI|nr:unnamed protein product [Blepharisma stoltei]
MGKRNKHHSKSSKKEKLVTSHERKHYLLKLNIEKNSNSRLSLSDYFSDDIKIQDLIPEQISPFLKEFLVSISYISQDFIQYFSQFKLKVLTLKSDIVLSQDQMIDVDISLRNELIQKVTELLALGLAEDMHLYLCKLFAAFMESLHKQLKLLNGKNYMQRIIGLYKSYQTIEILATEIGLITKSLHYYTSFSYENILKSLFYIKCFVFYENLISHCKKEDSHNTILKTVNKLEKELSDLAEKTKPLQIFDIFCCSNPAEGFKNLLSDSMTKNNSGVLCHINGEAHERRNRPRKSRISTAETSMSPKSKISISSDLDNEIEEFKHRLEALKPAMIRVKPKVNKEFLIRLQLQIKTISS